MGFNKATKQAVLVAAGRRCCLCARFKGVRLEVHHIELESTGGGNDVDNAIPLCFDCHADVGHYNPEHPRGNRYSPAELRRHRDRLYEQIESGRLPSAPATDEWAYCRYLVCKSFSALSEIVVGDLARTPAKDPLLVNTPALDEMRHLYNIHGNDDRASSVYGASFPNAEAYYAENLHKQDFHDPDCSTYPYFDAIRVPDELEIERVVGPSDPISIRLLRAGAPPEDVCVALGYDDPCQGRFGELYETRPIWATFLEIRNISTSAVTMGELRGLLDAPIPGYRSFAGKTGTKWSMQLPSAAILPSQSVLLPLGVFLGPLGRSLPASVRGDTSELDHAYYQDVDRVDYSSVMPRIGLLGTAIWPASITAESRDGILTQQFHELDFSRVYTVDRSWAMGSCPFLFFRFQDGRVEYVRELFANGLNRRTGETISVPLGAKGMIVAELERETTYIESMSVNGRPQLTNLQLHRGNWWELSVGWGDEIHLVGWYVPELPGKQDPLYHNQHICNFIVAQDMSRAARRR